MNHILTAKHGYRCAVLLNEIADSADIERALVKEPEVGWAAGLQGRMLHTWVGWLTDAANKGTCQDAGGALGSCLGRAEGQAGWGHRNHLRRRVCPASCTALASLKMTGACLHRLQGQDASPLAQWTELENGCICCSAKNDMVRPCGRT